MFKRVNDFFKRTDVKRKPTIPVEDSMIVEYQVVVPEVGSEYSLIFSTRKQARDYKRSLKDSKRGLHAKIIRREFDGDFIVSEREIY